MLERETAGAAETEKGRGGERELIYVGSKLSLESNSGLDLMTPRS